MISVKKFVFNSVEENTYLIYNEAGDAAIVDCGCMDVMEQESMLSFVDSVGLCPTVLLNTHLHFDHTWGASFVLKHWPQMQAYAHRAEVEEMPSPAKQIALFGLRDRLEDMQPDRLHYVQQGDVIQAGAIRIEVLDVPGHSPGHLAFYCPEGEFVMVGDALFRQDIGRTDLWGGNYEKLLESVRTRLFTLPPETTVYSGHGPKTSIREEIQLNPYFK